MKSARWSLLIFPGLLVIICLVIAFLNYVPGTFLSGWDTLHPEFDFSTNFKRLIDGVWRYEQGLGAIAGHSHMADLPRLLILWILHFVLPLNTLRYSYIFICLIIGPLGVYFLSQKIIPAKNPNFHHLIGFVTALFYLLNLGTVQQFYVPFEMFPTQWAYLPWIILTAFNYYKKTSKKNLLMFSLITLLATPQAYAAHLWYAFFAIFLTTITISTFITGRKYIKQSIILIGLTISLNSFWLLPNLYYIKTSSSNPKESKVNQLYSQEYLLKNRQTGYLKDVALVKGFYFNWEVYNPNFSRFEILMPEWNNHLKNSFVPYIGYIFFLFSIFGVILSFIKKPKYLSVLTPLWIIPFILLCNHTPPFSQLFDLLIRFPLLDEAFRFIFTKVSIMFTLALCLYFGYSLSFFYKYLTTLGTALAFTTIPITLLFIYALPIFQGQLISPKMKINIPQNYFQLWQFMKQQPSGRILTLPLHQFAGWQYYRWAYQGSGFLWFGLTQPILDRDFDRWNFRNEESYREFFNALYSQNETKFALLLQKYNIEYIVWDKDLITPSTKNRDQITFLNEIDSLMQKYIQNNTVKPINQFENLKIYHVTNSTLPSPIQTSVNILPSYHWGIEDNIFFSFGSYYSSTDTNPDLILPYRQLLDQNGHLNQKLFNIIQSDNQWIISSPPNSPFASMGFNFSPTDILKLNPNPNNLKIQNSSLIFSDLDNTTGISLDLNNLNHSQGYILAVKSSYQTGLPLRLCLKNTYNNICIINDQVSQNKVSSWDYFVVPTLDEMSGYNLSIENISLGNFYSKNTLEQVSIIPFNYQLFTQINQPIISNPKQIITNNQSYHPHWLAFYFKGFKPIFLKNHVLVNNWSNGWLVSPKLQSEGGVLPTTVYFLFWPQLLEFFGLALIPIVFVYIYRSKTTF